MANLMTIVDERMKTKMRWYDISLTKISVFFFTLALVGAFPVIAESLDWRGFLRPILHRGTACRAAHFLRAMGENLLYHLVWTHLSCNLLFCLNKSREKGLYSLY